jgi:hypothetical protein
MKFLIDKTNRCSNNSFSIDISEYSLNSLKIKHLFINNLKPLTTFQFYVQEDNSRNDGILISVPFDNDPGVILYHLEEELKNKCENQYEIEIKDHIKISSNENFNLVFTPLGSKNIYPVLGFTKSLYKHRKTYTSEIPIQLYLDLDPMYIYISLYYNNSNLISKQRIQLDKKLSLFNDRMFSYSTVSKFMNNVKIKFNYDEKENIPYTQDFQFTMELDMFNYNESRT